MINFSTRSAVSMTQMGINVVVNTTNKELDAHIEFHRTVPKKGWPGNTNIKKYYSNLKSLLLIEDKYFDSNPEDAKAGNPRWDKFMNDCLILATVDFYVNKRPIQLIHPDIYPYARDNALLDATSGLIPSVRPDALFIDSIANTKLN
jgi:hypothetical protein